MLRTDQSLAFGLSEDTDTSQAIVAPGDGFADDILPTLRSGSLVNGPIVVTATTNYSSDSISNVPSITFQTASASTATFTAAEFGAGLISSTATITGDSNTDTLKVDLGASHSFDASGLTFGNWSATDMFDIVGTSSGGDTITGVSVGTLIVELAGTGDTIKAGAGNDTIDMGGNFDATASIDGGAGRNTLKLNGDYSNYLSITAGMLQNVQKMELATGHTYDFAIGNGVVAAGQTMTIDGSALVAGNKLIVDVSADSSGKYIIDGGAGFNEITLNDNADIVHGGTGTNIIITSGVISASDQIDGMGSNNTLYLDGDYSAGFTFKATTLSDVQAIFLTEGESYKLTLNNADVAPGAMLSIEGQYLKSGDSLTFNGANETNGSFEFYAGDGKDTLTGGAGNDSFTFYPGDVLTAADHINGGGGSFNYLNLNGDYSGGLTFGASTIQNIQDIELGGGYSYKLTINDANVAAGQTLTIDGTTLGASSTLKFNGSHETNGNLEIFGGAGNDTLTGGKADNTFYGAGGADLQTSNGAADTFIYQAVSDSTSTTHDTIVGFNALTDHFEFLEAMHTPGAIDPAVTAGRLATASFDANLASAIGANQLHAGDAVLFAPTTGNLAGHTFLIVDENGIAGYQAGQDLVVDITGATNLAHLSTADFMT